MSTSNSESPRSGAKGINFFNSWTVQQTIWPLLSSSTSQSTLMNFDLISRNFYPIFSKWNGLPNSGTANWITESLISEDVLRMRIIQSNKSNGFTSDVILKNFPIVLGSRNVLLVSLHVNVNVHVVSIYIRIAKNSISTTPYLDLVLEPK